MSDQRTQEPPANTIEARIVAALRSIVDPELPGNIYDLGWVDDIAAGGIGDVHIRMTLLAPGGRAARALPQEVQKKLTAIPGVCWVEVEIVGGARNVTPVMTPNHEEDRYEAHQP